MHALYVIQHTSGEYLGLLEDHLEGRGVRFNYFRPFADGGTVPADAAACDSVMLLGGGPFGVVSGPLLPSMAAELRLARDCLGRGKPLIGFGLGAVLLATAAGGGAAEAPFEFRLTTARRVAGGALGDNLPAEFPMAVYMRDAPVLPANATVLAVDEAERPLVFQIGGNSFGFLGHPGWKSAMIEDLIMEFDEAPDDSGVTLEVLRARQGEIAEALSHIMVGIVRAAGLMGGE